MSLKSCRECGRPVSTEAPTCPSCGAVRPTVSLAIPNEGRQAEPTQQPSRAREMAGKALAWLISAFLALAALGAFMVYPIGGGIILIAAVIVLPPINLWLNRQLNIAIPWKAKAWLVLALLIWAGFSMASNQTRAEEEEAARAAAARVDSLRADFASNGPAIRQRMDSALKTHNYRLASSIGQRYVAVAIKDPQLARLYSDAQIGLKREADHAKERTLLAQAAATPSTNLEANREVYRQLVAIDPANTSDKARLDYYDKEIRKERAVAQARVRRFGPMPHRYSSGVYDEVEQYLPQVMNDPGSLEGLECTQVYNTERGWLVGCNWRGRNGFGGMVRQANWFIIRQERVVGVFPYSAYN